MTPTQASLTNIYKVAYLMLSESKLSVPCYIWSPLVASSGLLLVYYLSCLLYVIFVPAVPYPENHDYYYLYEGARTFLNYGVPKILYWPNSSSGLDIFAWDKFSLLVLFAGFLDVYGLKVHNIFIFDSLLKIGTLCFLFCSVYLLNRNWLYIGIVISLLLVDPLARFFLINKQYYGLAWGLLCLNFVLIVKFAPLRDCRFGAALISGLTAPILIFWFLPIGVYYLISLLLYVAAYVVIVRRYKSFVKFFLVYVCGLMITLSLFIFILRSYWDLPLFIASLVESLSIHVLYNDTGSYIPSRMLFVLETIFPSQGFSVFPVILVMLLRVIIDAARLGDKLLLNNNMLIAAGSCIFGYLIIGAAFPDNFYLARMSWAFPIVLYVFLKLIVFENYNHYGAISLRYLLAYLSGFGIYSSVESLVLPIFSWGVGLSVMFLTYFILGLFFRERETTKFLTARILILLPFAVCLWPAVSQIGSYSDRFYRGDLDSIVELLDQRRSNGFVASNFVLSAYSPNTNVHLIQSYKGLINGVTPQPADRLLYFVRGPGKSI